MKRSLDDVVAAAYLIDRSEQFKATSGTRALLEDIAKAIADGEHRISHQHGELDDLVERLSR